LAGQDDSSAIAVDLCDEKVAFLGVAPSFGEADLVALEVDGRLDVSDVKTGGRSSQSFVPR